jgi:hypothetical protein
MTETAYAHPLTCPCGNCDGNGSVVNTITLGVPRETEPRAVPVGGPRHYPAKTCAERGWHKCRLQNILKAANILLLYKCEDCNEEGTAAWARLQLQKEGDFLLELGEAVEDLAKRQIREHRTIFDSDNEGLNKAAERAGGKK